MKVLHAVAFALVIIGGLNWFLIGLFNWGIGELLPLSAQGIMSIVYIIIGLSALYLVVTHNKDCKHCKQ